jgi:hypothetical protein
MRCFRLNACLVVRELPVMMGFAARAGAIRHLFLGKFVTVAAFQCAVTCKVGIGVTIA